MNPRTLDETTLVAGQIAPADIPAAAALGVTTIVNNRPDREAPGQPSSAEIEAAVTEAGLAYHHLPVAGGIAPDQVAAMAELLEGETGKLLAFCTSGTRSTYLWALAKARNGGDGATILRQAEAAGYDLTPLRPYLG